MALGKSGGNTNYCDLLLLRSTLLMGRNSGSDDSHGARCTWVFYMACFLCLRLLCMQGRGTGWRGYSLLTIDAMPFIVE